MLKLGWVDSGWYPGIIRSELTCSTMFPCWGGWVGPWNNIVGMDFQGVIKE